MKNKDLIIQINKLLKQFFVEKERLGKNLGPEYQEIAKQVIDLTMLGTDRLRPLLVYYGYLLCHKKDQVRLGDLEGKFVTEGVLKLALAVELFHTAALIHDDIMDNAKLRRGKPTVLVTLGKNRAILAGDLALIWADEIFWSAKIPAEVLRKVKSYFDLLREEVIYGQGLDLSLSLRGGKSDLPTKQSYPKTRLPRSLRSLAMTDVVDRILRTYEYKTAKYSFERPLHLGAALAGASPQQLKDISEYAIPVGIAFQVRDDILDHETAQFGTIKEAENLARNFVNKGKKAILRYNGNSESKKFLLELADYCIERRD